MINLKDRLSELDVLLNYIDSEDWVKIPEAKEFRESCKL